MRASFLSRLTMRPQLAAEVAAAGEYSGGHGDLRETLESIFNLLNAVALDAGSQRPEALYHQLELALERLQRLGEQAGFNRDQTEDMRYALVALGDEVCVGAGGALRDYWMQHLMQLHFFEENVAGEVFFQRLERLLGGFPRAEVLEVYYLCLMFGFRGRYGGASGQIELSELATRVRSALERAGVASMEADLSPSGARPQEAYAHRGHNTRLLTGAVCFAVASVLLFLIQWIDLDGDVDVHVQSIANVLAGRVDPPGEGE